MPLKVPALPPNTDTMKRPPAEFGGKGGPLTMSPTIQVDHVNGIWRVTKHGRFYGDFLKEQHASSAGRDAAVIADPPS
jgi:hypothetical protein